jgi:hypothetical protein
VLAQTDSAQTDASQAGSGGEYSGPAILSRGETPAAQTAAPIAFRPYIGLSGIYDTGLLGVAATSTGVIPTRDLYGLELNLGAYTYHTWKHTTLALDYRGNFRHYSVSSWDGTDQFLSLILTHRPSKRVTFTLRNQGGVYSRNYFLSSTLGTLDPNYLQLPQNDIFSNRVVFVSTSGDLTYRKSARLSFNIGADGNLVRRQSSALYGVTGAIVRGDVEYRITRHSTLGADYRFTHFDYTRGFGNTDIHSVGFNYTTQFSPHLQFSARIGGARVESISLTEVKLDPAIAALLGQTVAIQAAHRLNYAPDMQARLTDTFRHSQFTLSYSNAVNPGNGVYLTSRSNQGSVSDMQARLTDTFRHSQFTLSYSNAVNPGNGVYLTSRSNQGSASYSYSGVRYWNFGADATYGRMTALVQTVGAYTSYGGGVGVTRELGKSLHAVLRLDSRHYTVAGTTMFAHNEYRATLGLAFSPGDVPLALW